MAEKLFETTYRQGVFGTTEIMVDQETGVSYIVVSNGQGISITPRLGRDGKPIITTIER